MKVVEIVPPTVATNLHRRRVDAEYNKEKNPGTLEGGGFMDFVRKGFEGVEDTIGAGTSVGIVERWFEEFGGDSKKAASA